MAHALAMRATSLVASTGILGAAVILALTATWAVQQFVPPERPVETSWVDPPQPPPPEPVRPTQTPPPLSPPSEITVVDPLPPVTAQPDAPPSQISFGPPQPVQIDNPRWSQRPTNLERYYPRRALQREIEGAAVLDCLVSTAGELTCSVISETPRGWDFGAAALRMAADHRMVPATRAGVPVEGRYRMRVPFNLD